MSAAYDSTSSLAPWTIRSQYPWAAERMRANHALEPTAASGLCRLAVPSTLRASAAAQRERYASSEASH